MKRAALIAVTLAGAILLVGGIAFTRTLMIAAPVESRTTPPPPPVDPMNVARRLSQAIRFKTVSYGEGVREAERSAALRDLHDWMDQTYPYFHEDAPQEIFGDSLLFVWRGLDENLPPVLLMAHLDVAPVADGTEGDWTHEPFSGDIADGYVWGRGALDNKSAAIAILEAGDRLAQSNFQPRRTIMFAFGEDQEAGGTKGNAAIAKALAQRGVHLAWVLDEGSPILTQPYPGVERPIAFVSIAEKGYLRLELAAKGEDGGAALSRAVENALNHVFPSDLDEIQRAKLSVLAPFAPFGERLKLANLWLTKPFVIGAMQAGPDGAAVLRTTIAPAMPDSAPQESGAATDLRAIDVYLHPRDSITSVTEQVTAAIHDPEIEIRPLSATEAEPSRIEDINGEAYAHIARAIAENFVVPVAPELMTRPTDAHYYADVADALLRFRPFPAGPDDLSRVRGTDERVAVSDLGPAVGFYMWLIRNSE